MKQSKKIKIQITHWLTGSILFEYEAVDNTLVKTIREADLRGADLRGADLREADLRGANLWGANLWGANLRGANLWGANLWGANLWEADLREADLRGANLWGANLWGANLWGADLRGADLRGADLRGADLWGANGIVMYWHIHHEILVENLTEPLKNRKNYIKSDKPKDEVKLRLKLLKKVKAKQTDYPQSKSGWEKLHKIECGCGWDGKTIFTKKNELIK